MPFSDDWSGQVPPDDAIIRHFGTSDGLEDFGPPSRGIGMGIMRVQATNVQKISFRGLFFLRFPCCGWGGGGGAGRRLVEGIGIDRLLFSSSSCSLQC